jgi:hypothetical protein
LTGAEAIDKAAVERQVALLIDECRLEVFLAC